MLASYLHCHVKLDPNRLFASSSASSATVPVTLANRLLQAVQRAESQPSVSVHELASSLGISAAHLQRLFKRATGLNISQLLVEHRCQAAARLLLEGNQQVKEIAHAVGYEHPPSFVRAFQRRFGQTPGLYRKQNAFSAVTSGQLVPTAT